MSAELDVVTEALAILAAEEFRAAEVKAHLERVESRALRLLVLARARRDEKRARWAREVLAWVDDALERTGLGALTSQS